MKNKIFDSFEEAVADIFDGAMIAFYRCREYGLVLKKAAPSWTVEMITGVPMEPTISRCIGYNAGNSSSRILRHKLLLSYRGNNETVVDRSNNSQAGRWDRCQ